MQASEAAGDRTRDPSQDAHSATARSDPVTAGRSPSRPNSRRLAHKAPARPCRSTATSASAPIQNRCRRCTSPCRRRDGDRNREGWRRGSPGWSALPQQEIRASTRTQRRPSRPCLQAAQAGAQTLEKRGVPCSPSQPGTRIRERVQNVMFVLRTKSRVGRFKAGHQVRWS